MNTTGLARLLAERLEEEGERAGAALTLRELLGRYVPYEVARGPLELAAKSEYDLLVLEFLADRRLVVLRDPAAGEAARQELETPEPTLAPLEEHADVLLRLDLATISGGYRGSGSGPGRPASAAEPREAEAPPAGGPSPPEGGSEEEVEDGTGEEPEVGAAWDPTGGMEARPAPDAGEPAEGPSGSGGAFAFAPTAECRSCGRGLPEDGDPPVRFCPHCGAERPEHSCVECGARLEPGWSYCPACGGRAGSGGGSPGGRPDAP